MTEFFPLLWWALGVGGLVGGAIYSYIEFQASRMRTRIETVPNGLRFEAHGFSVEVQHARKEVIVVADHLRHVRKPLPEGDDSEQSGALTVNLAAVGLRIEVARINFKAAADAQEGDAPKPSDWSRIVLRSNDEKMRQAQGGHATEQVEVYFDRVPNRIAADFQQFANGVRAWVEKIEHKLDVQIAQRREKEAQDAMVAAGLTLDPIDDTSAPLSEADREARAAAQLEKWRAAAGFKGSSTELSFDARGQIVWLIDLDPTGRVILHANQRSFFGSLKGAQVTGIGSELEIAVRDDYWSEEDPRLVQFRVLAGSNAESRRAWKERLEILIQSLSPVVHQPR